jgi:hypothetical protein
LLRVFLFYLVENSGSSWIGQGGDDVGGVVGGHDFDEADELIGVEVCEQLLGDDGAGFFNNDFPGFFGEQAVDIESLKRTKQGERVGDVFGPGEIKRIF